MRTTRRATYNGSQPPSSIRASQYSAAVRIGAAHRLVQGRDLVVELVATLVEAAPAAAGDLLGNLDREFATACADQPRRQFQQLSARRASPSAARAMSSRASGLRAQLF